MPPELIPSNYSKNLDERPRGVSENLYSSTYYLSSSSRLFRIKHSLISDSGYDGCVEVYEMVLFEGNEDFFIEHMLPEVKGKSSEDAVKTILGFGMHEGSTKCIARFVYVKCHISTHNEILLGAQIRGANVNDDFSGEGIAAFVYSWLLKSFGCLISDNKQTQDGAGLWAYKFSTMYTPIHIYDQASDTYSGTLTEYLSKQCGGNVWSTNTLKAGDVADEGYSVSFDDCYNKVVLFITGS